MASTAEETIHDFHPFFKVYKDGHVEKYPILIHENVPPTHEPVPGVEAKDVVVFPETGVSARIFTPKIDGPDHKLPLIVHYHGGGFCIGSPFDSVVHKFLTYLTAQTKAVVASVDYRLAPEHPLPIAYEDSWAFLQWISSHSNGQGPEPVLNKHVDFNRVFLTGESAGGTIAHYVAVRAGVTPLDGLKIVGSIFVHPFFGLKDEEIKEDKMYKFMCQTGGGHDDPILFPEADPNLSKMAGSRILVCLAEKDFVIQRGLNYYETLCKSGYKGDVELFISDAEEHCFHLFDFDGERASSLMKRVISFIYQD